MKYGKFVIATMVVILMEFGISYLVAQKLNIFYLDAMFYVGLSLTLIFVFFSSTGGLFTNYSEMTTAKSYLGFKNNYKLTRKLGSLSINCLNVGSLLFFLIGLATAFITSN
ncbi:hypothetical protein [Niallia sp. MER 6]|uniref:hypothetical protein n=1 Tax=Niallia sp. MER 6 TaxID=2939567 RepID=UPI00203E4C70|nr:hypothetical protein [Niallia sp. MER 6]MCM3030129.1 hypothetical protein [Niallia sp. MER 6]